METIDTYFRYCAEISKNYERTIRSGEITHVKNVFKDPYRMLKFQSLLTKWESCQNSKPGIMSLKIPYWTADIIGDELLELSEHDSYKNESEFYYFYYNNTCMEMDIDNLVSNNCVLPHTDPSADRSVSTIIGLINLNHRDVSTAFWRFKGRLMEDTEDFADEYNEYVNGINYDNYDEKARCPTLYKAFEMTYGFNEAIFYDSKCFHSPVIDKHYTRENPRIMMRVSYMLDEEDDECYDE